MQTVLFRRLPIQRLFHAATALAGAGALGVSLALAPGVGAQQVPSAQSLVVRPADLGPGWTTSVERTEGERWDIRHVEYVKGSRTATFEAAVAPNVGSAEDAVKHIRARYEEHGATILSVQDRGFGDGNAFKIFEIFDGKLFLAYLFRVQNVGALAAFEGPASDVDAAMQAESFARLQEGKLWAVFAPPAPTPAPTATPAPPQAIPAPIPTPTSVTAVAVAPVVAPAPIVAVDPYCMPGQKPAFAFGFAALKERLGPIMGNPTSCEYGDPKGSGDTLQNTSAGLSFYRKSTNTPTFTTGFEHWAQTDGGLVYWTGDSIDPTPDAQVVESPA